MTDSLQCSNKLRDVGIPYPRTCYICRLGPCRFLSQTNTHSVAPPPPGATEAGSVQPSADPATHHASRNGEG